jgi:nitrogen fixation/metabolism regulation signal transduction histidine kinase
MKTLIDRSQFFLLLNLIGLIAGVLLLSTVYQSLGLSSTFLLVLLVTVGVFLSIFSLFKRQNSQVKQVIKALANGDNTLGFGAHHPMRDYFDEVRQQMQLARFTAEQQSEFFKTLLIHINLAVMVCDAKGNVIEANPAVSRLLGKNIKHLEDLNAIGVMILASEKPIYSTVQWQNGEQQDTLTLQVSIAEIQGKVRKIITLQSIHELLLNKEQQAYKRLTHVLTHEVANTITPLASLAQTCEELVPEELSFSDEESKQDLKLALSTLATRTEYLGQFIESFKEISSLPSPVLAPTQIGPIVERLSLLHQQQLSKNNIVLDIAIQNQQLVMLDSAQVEQVLINLMTNAIDALSISKNQQNTVKNNEQEQAKITITVGQNSTQQLYVEIADNGLGISAHVVDMIFVPFFTTKQQGSGIGLSLSRQIMINHGGDLVYISREKGACFRCVFG